MLWTIEPASGFAAVASVCDRRNRRGSALTERRYRAKVQMKADFGMTSSALLIFLQKFLFSESRIRIPKV
jgi:hypothetical protein